MLLKITNKSILRGLGCLIQVKKHIFHTLNQPHQCCIGIYLFQGRPGRGFNSHRCIFSNGFGGMHILNRIFDTYIINIPCGSTTMPYFGKRVVRGSTPTSPSLQSTCVNATCNMMMSPFSNFCLHLQTNITFTCEVRF